MGSVFSPYYALAGRRAPEDHVALNVALYGRGATRWAMTERGRDALWREERAFSVGKSVMRYEEDSLTVEVDERCAPAPFPLRGRIRFWPDAVHERIYPIDADGRHHWRPIAPLGALEIEFSKPRLRWRGRGYFDSNAGCEPLEKGFRRWSWSRAQFGEARALVCYDAEGRAGSGAALSLEFERGGDVSDVPAPPMRRFPSGGWGVFRQARLAEPPQTIETWEDTPFYVRGRAGHVVYETLDLDRFASPIVKAMLPFRMPRFSGRRPRTGPL